MIAYADGEGKAIISKRPKSEPRHSSLYGFFSNRYSSDTDALSAFVSFLFFIGLRPNEAHLFPISHIDFFIPYDIMYFKGYARL